MYRQWIFPIEPETRREAAMSDDDDLTRRIRGVGALTEPVRRALYLFVAGQAGPVSREAAAAGVGVARHLAKFHLDRLVEEGLLEAHFQRLTGRTGPGAGRPAKLYRRATGEMAVSLPERQYRLAGELMAAAIDTSARTGVPVLDALTDAAARRGREIGTRARVSPSVDGPAVPGVPTSGGQRDAAAARGTFQSASEPDAAEPSGISIPAAEPDGDQSRAQTTGADGPAVPRSGKSDGNGDREGAASALGTEPRPLLDRVCAVLGDEGYEPMVSGDEVVLRNCPFHALAAEHTALVCGMNLSLLGSLGDALGAGAVNARLDPAPGRCCVVLTVG
jgi:predicted ArsR family transcriptional regulator